VPNGIERRALILSTSFMMFIGMLFIGPSKMFLFPDNVWMAAIGQVIHGIFGAYIMVPSLPETINSVIKLYPG